MIQFLGLHLDLASASAAALGRDLDLWATASTRIVNAAQDDAAGTVEVPCAEWVRAGCYALQEAYLQLPVKARKVWGLGLAGPDGWIALDFDLEPLSPLRLTAPGESMKDFRRWLDQDRRLERRVMVVLSPKDYFRYQVSGSLAADVTTASKSSLLIAGESHWSESELAEAGIQLAWMPPVFDPHVPTGRLSEEGIRRTGVPGGVWLVAGAHQVEAALVASGDLRKPYLWVQSRPGSPALLAYGVPGLDPVLPPPGWQVTRSAMAGSQLLERYVEAPGLESEARSPGGLEQHPLLAAHRGILEGAGLEVAGVRPASTNAALGAAALAAVGSGLVKGWDSLYRAWPAPSAPA